VARLTTLAAALAVSLLAVSGAGGASAQKPRFGGTVFFGNVAEPACLNPLIAPCASEATRYIAELILLPAFDVSPQYTYRKRLVSRVKITKKPPFTLTYHIRPAARWSDGVQITARDFVFTHDARRAQRKDLSEDERQGLRRVRSVSRVDAKTVRVVLRARYSGWRAALFGNVLPAHALKGSDLTTIWRADRIDDPTTGRSIGSGPFLLESWERGRQLTLVRNPRYWGPHRAYLDRLVIRFRTESDSPVDLFQNGEWDIAHGIFGDAVSALRRAGVKVLCRRP
jgi:peptide/nickel transport system substrate-binding protein